MERHVAVVIIGGGGHASDVLSVFEAASVPVAGFQDDGEPDMRRFEGRAVHLGRIGSDCPADGFAWGIGWPLGRRAVLPLLNLEPVSIVHPRATVHPNARIGRGTVIMAGAVVSAGAVIGDHVLIHHNAVIGHDCRAGDFVSVMPGAAVSGDTTLGEGCLIGANATVIQGVAVGAWARLGAGSVATRNVPPGVTAVGAPAAELEKRPAAIG